MSSVIEWEFLMRFVVQVCKAHKTLYNESRSINGMQNALSNPALSKLYDTQLR